MRQERFLQLARKESKKSDHKNHALGCCIVRGNKILGVGYNTVRTHPHSPHGYKSIHAEYMAFLNSGRNVIGATAYIFRELKNGTPAMSRPCESCWKFLVEMGIKKVVYSFEGSFMQEKL